MIWIGYTTRYRGGGPKFERAAQTLQASEAEAGAVICEAVESKADFVHAMARVEKSGRRLQALHFIGHGGMYGPMFRTTNMPEQFSPHEWRTLSLPFAEGASAYFHTCRSARWFAPFFARTFGVSAYGYHGYTSISLQPDRFVWEAPWHSADTPLYIVACAGRKTDGLMGSIGKYAGFNPVESLRRFAPDDARAHGNYDAVSTAYAELFEDITVRDDEWRWLQQRFDRLQRCYPKGPRVLDLGCGNGALLSRLASNIRSGTGVDASPNMIALAKSRAAQENHAHLSFFHTPTPTLPFADNSFDVITSLLSFRYLDWDPIMAEIRRVLAPGGKLLILDMAALPASWYEMPRLLRDKIRQTQFLATQPVFKQRLKALVDSADWKHLLKFNPVRAEHEYRWYLESRFPGRTVEVLNIARRSRLLAFDSGPLPKGWTPPQSYP